MASEPDRRLHPFSPLFVLLIQLRQLAVPLVLLLVFGRGGFFELMGAGGAVVLALYALVYSLGFRYRLGEGEIVIREGILGRTERHVPFARIQNIVQQRNPLHRLFGVTELRLESAGGTKPEAVMNVITVEEAARIEAVLRGRAAVAETDLAEPLLQLSPREIVRLGLTTNRGIVLLGALWGLMFQFEFQSEFWDRRAIREAVVLLRRMAGAPWSLVDAYGLVTAALVLVVVFPVALKLMSIVMAFVSFHRFRVWRDGERVATESGLLTRKGASARRDKIQRLLLDESWIARWMGRRSLSCEVAAGLQATNESDSARLRWLVPIGTPADVDRIVREVGSELDLDRRLWRPLHPRAWRRRVKPLWIVWTLASALLARFAGWWMLAIWPALLVTCWFAARGWARFAAYSCDEDGVLAVRAGWLHRQWTVAYTAKGQAVQLRQSPFDRRHGMATVTLDTAGAATGSFPLQVPYLPEAEARALVERLSRGISR